MKNNATQNLIQRRLQEASLGTSMTAEKVPSGGAAHDDDAGNPGNPDDGPTNVTVEVECGEADCDAVIAALGALKDAGAAIHCVKMNGEEYDLATGEPKAPEGSPEHEGAETPEHERAEHGVGGAEAGEPKE